MTTVNQAGSGVIVGKDPFKYRVVQDWAKLPAGWMFEDACGVAVDKNDRVYVCSRGGHPITIFDRDGTLLSSWGENIFTAPHGLHIGPDGNVYCTDNSDHTVRKCTPDGKVLLELGTPGRPAPAMSGLPFNRCTNAAVSRSGDIYVSDGYQNARVHKYASDGKLLTSWGESGSDPGQFSIPHSVCVDDEGWVYVADRENHRIQVFDGNGKYETEWHNLYRPCVLFMERGPNPLVYVGELSPSSRPNLGHPNLGSALKVVKGGKVLVRIGDPVVGTEPGQFLAPHGVAVDSRGDVYLSQTPYSYWPIAFPGNPKPPERLPSVIKFEKVT